MVVTRLEVQAADGQTVVTRIYPGPAPRSVVLIAGAFAVPQRYYARYANDLASRGHAVVTVDYRGLGESRPAQMRGFSATAMDWVRDLEAAVAAAQAKFPNLPLEVVAHSFGGQVVPLARFAGEVTRMTTLGTQFVNADVWTGRQRWQMAAIFNILIPVVSRIFGYLPGWTGIGEDTPAEVAREWAQWCRSPRYLLDHVPQAEDAYAAFGAPVTAIAITDDDYAPSVGVRLYAQWLPRAEVEVIEPTDLGLRAVGHFGPFRPRAKVLWDRVAAGL